MVRLISRSDVAKLLTMPETILNVEEAYKQLVLGTAVMPQRTAITNPTPGLTLIMPACIGGSNALATKIVSVYKNNPEKFNKPTTLAKIMVQDINTGEIIGILDGGLITAMRTGAATAISVKYLAKKNSKTVGIYGAGVQARKQIVGVYWILQKQLRHVKVYDIKNEQSVKFKEDLEKELGIEVEIVEKSTDLVKDTDIIIAATTSPSPLFDGKNLSNGVHISSIGAHSPTTRELDETTVLKANLLVADFKPACLAEAGDYILPIKEGKLSETKIVSIGDIILGNAKGRTSDDQITIFKSVGLAVQDVAVAKAVYDLALKKQIGQEIEF